MTPPTPRETASYLLNGYGDLDRALALARSTYKKIRKMRRPSKYERNVVEYLEVLAKGLEDLRAIEESYPITVLATQLVASGVTLSDLETALAHTNGPLRRQLKNRFKELSRAKSASLPGRLDHFDF